jgi:uncharacterized membrane protein YgdD (TMEM256/DUF423 family)
LGQDVRREVVVAARWFVAGAIFGATGVMLGAFGAHGLKSRVGPDVLQIWETAAKYQLLHALALLATAWAAERWPGAWTNAAGWLFSAGIVLFSGSLYALVLTGVRTLGAITPLGGLAFIAGWVCLALGAWRGR